MSPRAAWQLEAIGFTKVYDYSEGKLDWIARGLPVEGAGPHYGVAGEVADRDAVLACRVGDHVRDVAPKLASEPHDYCVVLNEQGVVLGRMRTKDLRGRSHDDPVEVVMEPGPTTLRPKEPAAALLERMKKKNVPTVIVTTKTGRLVGAVTQNALTRLLSRTEPGVSQQFG
ncbi:MAG: CBS domain-containing protein [Actinomycetota bacterium]